MKNRKIAGLTAVLMAGMIFMTGCGDSAADNGNAGGGALMIADQGIFSAGGITVTSDGTFDPEDQWEESGAGQTAHVDHANVFYQIPAEETGLPMVFLHGYGQSRMGWMTTPDGREGWSDLFLRMGHSVFLIDEPRRGEAGATSVSGEISTKTLDQRWYTQFRIGRWENGESVANEGSQFPNDERSVDQFFRQMMRQACYDFEEAYNAQGGNCTVVDLPEEGITGNDHFMFQDLNNDVIAEHVESWIQEHVK